jgi:hypothetical protein
MLSAGITLRVGERVLMRSRPAAGVQTFEGPLTRSAVPAGP